MILVYTKEEIEELRRAHELAEAVKIWHKMLQNGDLNSDVFIKLVGEKIEEIERRREDD
ncbi:hypothetical protein NSQ14_12865 [Caldifermentibacillus hisashii]|uniref:hypothetical protein n=1 Tax=Caldifermentibacillus hisashii TaxID=996558 RepID=UPI0031FDA4DC